MTIIEGCLGRMRAPKLGNRVRCGNRKFAAQPSAPPSRCCWDEDVGDRTGPPYGSVDAATGEHPSRSRSKGNPRCPHEVSSLGNVFFDQNLGARWDNKG